MDSDGWLDPGAASGGLNGALPLGAPADGIRRLRMRGVRREPRQMPADGLGGSLHWGPGSQLRHLPARVAGSEQRIDCALVLDGSTVKEALKAGVLYFDFRLRPLTSFLQGRILCPTASGGIH